jgi:hypothetical protein
MLFLLSRFAQFYETVICWAVLMPDYNLLSAKT